jgi:hypothetical protein
MNDSTKEIFLHKIVASSAFLCALCILPVAQYFLVTSKLPSGEVAGVSTEEQPVIQASILSPEECASNRTKELADLQNYLVGTKIAFQAEHDATVAPYKQAMAALQGDPETIATEKAALEKLIKEEGAPYLEKVSALDSAVESQKKEIESRSCLAE